MFEYLGGRVGQLRGGQCLHLAVDRLHRVDLVVGQKALADPQHVTLVALHRDGELGDELLLGHRELAGGEPFGAEPVQFAVDQLAAAVGVAVVRAEVDGYHAAVAVGV